MLKLNIKRKENIADAAAGFLEKAVPGRVYAFFGSMGAGKTTFISELCRLLGADEEASSPTFSIANEYETQAWGKVYHLDCYRLKDEEDALETGVEEYFNSGCACFVEWPEKIEGLLPEDTVTVEIEVSPDGSRVLTAAL